MLMIVPCSVVRISREQKQCIKIWMYTIILILQIQFMRTFLQVWKIILHNGSVYQFEGIYAVCWKNNKLPLCTDILYYSAAPSIQTYNSRNWLATTMELCSTIHIAPWKLDQRAKLYELDLKIISDPEEGFWSFGLSRWNLPVCPCAQNPIDTQTITHQ